MECSGVGIYLQGFVKMVGANVGAMEEQLTQAEGELSTLPGAFKKIFRTISVPSFLNVRRTHLCSFFVLFCSVPLAVWGVCLICLYFALLGHAVFNSAADREQFFKQ